MRKILCGCLMVMALCSQAQSELPMPWQPGAITDDPVLNEFGGSVLFSTFSGIAPMSFAVNSQVFTVSGGMTGIPAGYANAAADDFTIPLADGIWEIKTLQVQGSYFLGTGPAQSLNVYILGNSGMLPDTTNLSAGSIYVAENISYTDVGTGDFEIDLPGGGLNLGPGTYWLVVQANMDAFSTGQWGWRESSAAADSGTAVGFESAWFENATLFNACTGAWGARIATCGITQPPNGTPSEPDLAFAIVGTATPAGVTVTPTSGLSTNEAGGTAQFSVVLDAPPTDTVDIAIASLNPSEGTPDTANLSFNTANWNIPQTVTITGVDDAIAEATVFYTIDVGPITSTDTRYSVIDPPNVSLSNFDDDTAGITVFDIFVEVTENGPTMTFDVMANTPPTDTVMLPLAVTDATEASIAAQAMSGSAITIALPSGSTAPVTVTVSALDDLIDDGDISIQVGPGDPSSTGDAIYDALVAAEVTDVKVLVRDDDTAGITVTPGSPEPMQTDEAMTLSPTFTVVLNTEPLLDVTIPLFASDPSEGSLDMASLTFTPMNWNMAQTVTVSGVNDDIDDGTVSYTAVTEPANSGDPAYQGLDGGDVLIENLDDADATGITVTPNGVEPLVTTEAGGTATFDVVLTSEPLFDVNINLAADDATEGASNTPTLVFTPMNWNMAQTVTMTGQDDFLDDGDINYNAVLDPAVTNDPTYTGFDANDVTMVNQDDDTAGITVAPTSGLVTAEDGTTDSFTVVLEAQPSSDVNINLASDDATEGTASTATLTFTDMNWNMAQTITVTGEDDDIDDGDVAYNIVLDAATSMDMAFAGIDPDDVAATNQDDDTAGIDVMPTAGLMTSEDPMVPPATFDVVLTSEPVADVTINLASDNLAEGITDVPSLTFTDMDWNVAQTVTVTGVDDLLFDGDVPYNVILDPATSGDPNYGGVDPSDVSLINLDDEFCGPVTITTQIGNPIIVVGSPGCTFDLYSNACGSDNSQWILIAAGITIGPSGEVTVPGVIGIEDTCYVATVTNDIDQPLNTPLRTVPTLGTVALIFLVGLLLAYGIWTLRKQQITT